MEPKAFVVPALTSLTAILMIASIATPMLTFESGGSTTKYGLFEECTDGSCKDVDLGCTERENLRKGIIAFTILAIIGGAFAAILSILRIFVTSLAQGALKMVVFILSFLTVFFTFFPWVFSITLWDRTMCGQTYKDIDGLEWGPGAPLAIVSFAVIIVATVAEYIINQPFSSSSSATGASSSSEPAAAVAVPAASTSEGQEQQ